MRRVVFASLLLSLLAAHSAAADEPMLTIDPGGHLAKIMDVMFTSDGRYLATASYDKTVRVWDVESGDTVRVLRGQSTPGIGGAIFAAALSPDDRLLAVGGWMGPTTGYDLTDLGVIRLIDFASGEITGLLTGHSGIIDGVAFSGDGRRLISGDGSNKARIWDVASRRSLCVLEGHTSEIYGVALNRDGSLAATGSDDATIKLWNGDSGRLIRTLEGHRDKVRAVAFSPDGRYLLSGSADKSIRLWDGRSGAFIKVLAEQNREVDSLSVSPDGTLVLTGHSIGSGDRTNNVFAIPSGRNIASFTGHGNIVLATAISPDNRLAATAGGSDRLIALWDLRTGKSVREIKGKGQSVWAVAFARDGRSIAWGKTWEKSDLSEGRGPLEKTFIIKTGAHDYDLSLGPDATDASDYRTGITRVGSTSIGTPDGEIHKSLEIRKNGAIVHTITRTSGTGFDHRCISLTPDGRTVLSGGSNGHLESYDAATGNRLHQFIGHTGSVWSLAPSPDGRLLVTGASDQTVRLWEIDTGRLLMALFQGSDNEWVAWTPAGYYTASLKGDQYVGWHINQGPDKAALYYPASRFADRFFQPVVVANYIRTGGDITEAIRLANLEQPRRQQITETLVSDLKGLLPPAVFIQTPAGRDNTVTAPRVHIRAVAKSLTAEPITDIWVMLNGRRIDKKRAIQVAGKDGAAIDGLRADLDITLPLTETKNRIAVIAANRHSQSEPEIVNVTWQGAASPGAAPDSHGGDVFKPDLYVLAIGVSKYLNPDYNLDFADKDASGVAGVFEKQAGKLFRKIHKRALTDAAASKDNILDALDWILAESTQKDLSIIFVAGHGLTDDGGNYYYLPHDGDVDRLRRTAIKWFDFQDVVTRLPSKVILMVDTCHSGSVTGKRRGASDVTAALRELVTTESGVVVMTASTGREYSVEHPDWGHGAFTKALIEGLEGKANYDDNKTVDIKELDLYVTQRVKALTGGKQHPTTEIPKTLPNFPVAYH